MNMIIYKITNKINNKEYIGQTTKTLDRRWKQHCETNSQVKLLSNAIKKYGKENFLIEIIIKCNNLDDLNSSEIYYISQYNTLTPNGYNIHRGGNNKFHSDKTIVKLSNIKKGHKDSEETKRKKIKALTGRPVSLETRVKISNSRKGKKLSDKTKLLIGLSSKGRTPWNKGIPRSEEYKQKMSLIMKNKPLPKALIDNQKSKFQDPEGKRICSICLNSKELTDFHNTKGTRHCKVCLKGRKRHVRRHS